MKILSFPVLRSLAARLFPSAPALRKSLAACVLFGAVLLSSAGAVTIVEYNLSGAGAPGTQASNPASSSAANTTGAALTRGAGLTGTAAANSISASGWTGEATDYFEFGFDVAPGFQVALDQIYIGTRSSGTGPGTVGIYSSLDGYATPVISLTQGNGTFVNTIVDVSSLGAVTGSVRFRVRAIGTNSANGGTTASSGTFRLTGYFVSGVFDRNMQVTGTVSEMGGGDSQPPLATIFAPVDNATNVPITATPSMTFNEAVKKGATGSIHLKRTSDGSVFESIATGAKARRVIGRRMSPGILRMFIPTDLRASCPPGRPSVSKSTTRPMAKRRRTR